MKKRYREDNKKEKRIEQSWRGKTNKLNQEKDKEKHGNIYRRQRKNDESKMRHKYWERKTRSEKKGRKKKEKEKKGKNRQKRKMKRKVARKVK